MTFGIGFCRIKIPIFRKGDSPMYHFDQPIQRKGTNSLKYDFTKERGKPEDALPLWVADMDFQAPPPVIEALLKSCSHGIFGYSEAKTDYFKPVQQWFSNRFDWAPEEEWLVKTPGVVFAICTAIRALTKPGDGILIQRPVYYPFHHAIESNQRILVNNPLVYENGAYRLDLDDFEQKIEKQNVKLFILCNPHNPVGRVWTKEELTQMGDICSKHHVTIISDEIHCDFVRKGHHIVFAGLKPEFRDMTITCTAPSKTFNIAGLQVSNIFIPNPVFLKAFQKELYRTGVFEINTFGLVACNAAYTYGAPWLSDLKVYLEQNFITIKNFLQEHLPKITIVEPEGTYLLWIDFKKYELSDDKLNDMILNKSKLWLDEGTMFGPEGSGFQRLNMACPKATIEKALDQLRSGFQSY